MPHFWPNKSHNDCDKMSAVATALTVYIGYARETLAADRPSHSSVAIGRDVSRVCGINSRALSLKNRNKRDRNTVPRGVGELLLYKSS